MPEYIIELREDSPLVRFSKGENVRCKDCKYYEDEELGMVYCPNIVGGWVSDDFFCKDGERDELER